MFFDEQVVLLQVDARDAEDAIRTGANALQEKGLVKDTYCENVLKRESKYPTGLMTGDICVAIPHTDTVHVNRSQVAVLQLKHPVIFKAMDDIHQDVPARLIFMLAMKEPHEQVDMLTKLMGMFGQQDLLQKFTECRTSEEVLSIVKGQGLE